MRDGETELIGRPYNKYFLPFFTFSGIGTLLRHSNLLNPTSPRSDTNPLEWYQSKVSLSVRTHPHLVPSLSNPTVVLPPSLDDGSQSPLVSHSPRTHISRSPLNTPTSDVRLIMCVGSLRCSRLASVDGWLVHHLHPSSVSRS
jgi:hypothetical protein